MPDALPIPADLVELQRAFDQADADAKAYADAIAAERREQYPDPEQTLERAQWTEEQTARLEALRAVRAAAVIALHRHPTMVQARETGCYQQTEAARREAAREG